MNNLLLFLFSIYEKCVSLVIKPIFYKEKKFPLKRRNERPTEFAFAFDCISRIYPKTLLDVGTGTTSFPHLVANCGIRVKAIDYIETYWTFGMSNRHFPVERGDITKPDLKEKFDMVTCISVLEHIPEHRKAVSGMFGLLNPNGYVVLTFPYNENHYLPDVYRHPDAGYGSDHKFIAQVYSRNEIDEWLQDNNAQIIEQKYYEFFTGEFWTMGDFYYPIRESSREKKHQLTCLLLQKK